MAAFKGWVQGSRGIATRLGSKKSGLTLSGRGHALTVSVVLNKVDDKEVVAINVRSNGVTIFSSTYHEDHEQSGL